MIIQAVSITTKEAITAFSSYLGPSVNSSSLCVTAGTSLLLQDSPNTDLSKPDIISSYYLGI